MEQYTGWTITRNESSDSFGDLGGYDEAASINRFCELLRERLAAEFPGADITVNQAQSTRPTEVYAPEGATEDDEISVADRVDDVVNALFGDGEWAVATGVPAACAKCGDSIAIADPAYDPARAGEYLCDPCADRQEAINRAHNVEAVAAALPDWAGVLGDVNWPAQSGLNALAASAICAIDVSLAPGSETILLGYALADLRRAGGDTDPSCIEQLAWWGRAYQALYDVTPSDYQRGRADFDVEAATERENRVVDLLLHGDLEQAERAALGEADD